MRIAGMIVTPIAVSDPPLLNAAGLHAPYALRTTV
jgi:glucarate dehydratase